MYRQDGVGWRWWSCGTALHGAPAFKRHAALLGRDGDLGRGGCGLAGQGGKVFGAAAGLAAGGPAEGGALAGGGEKHFNQVAGGGFGCGGLHRCSKKLWFIKPWFLWKCNYGFL